MADSLPGNAAPEQFRDTITFSSLFATTDQVALQAPSGATVAVRFVTPAAKPGSRPHTIAIHPPSASPASPVIDDPEPVFRALGDATRYAIARLIAREAMTSADLARRLGVSGPTLTHHLKLLRQTRLVIEERRGNSILLRLDRRAIETLSVAAVGSLFGAGPVAIRRSRRA
jgi:DNA-binding transcriptional ArsR family regulator